MNPAWFRLISTIPVDARAILVKTFMAGCSFRWNLNYFSRNIECISAQSSLLHFSHWAGEFALSAVLQFSCNWCLFLVIFSPLLQKFWIVSVVIQHFSDSTVNLLSTQLSLWPLSETFSIQIVQKKTVLKSDFNWLGPQINSIFKSNFVNWRDFPIWREYFSRALCHWSALLQLWIVLYCYIKDVTVMRWFESFCVVLLWWF